MGKGGEGKLELQVKNWIHCFVLALNWTFNLVEPLLNAENESTECNYISRLDQDLTIGFGA